MTQQELYELSGKLTTTEMVYLAASHLEHLRNMEYGGEINAGDRIFEVRVKCTMKERVD